MIELRPGERLVTRADLMGRRVPCRECGAPMLFVLTEKGKRMPLSVSKARELTCSCQAQNLPGKPPPGRCEVCLSAGVVFAVVSHWSDCPKAQAFRKAKAEKRNTMNTEHPHEIVRLEKGQRVPPRHIQLTEEEAAHLGARTPEEREAWIRARRAALDERFEKARRKGD